MGKCLEFAVTITAGCEHPMLAQSDCCVCEVCGTRCTGRFGGCPSVWAAADAPSPLSMAANGADSAPAAIEADLAIDWASDAPAPVVAPDPQLEHRSHRGVRLTPADLAHHYRGRAITHDSLNAAEDGRIQAVALRRIAGAQAGLDEPEEVLRGLAAIAERGGPGRGLRLAQLAVWGSRRRQRRRLGAMAAVVALAGAGLGVVLATSGGADPSGVGIDTVRASELQFKTVAISDTVDLERNWRLEGATGNRFIGTLTFSNSADTVSPVVYDETLPKSLADSVNVVLFDPYPIVINPDPVFEYQLQLDPHARATVTYEISVPPDGADPERLDAWAKDVEKELAQNVADAEAALAAAKTAEEQAAARAFLEAAQAARRSFKPTPHASGCTYCGGTAPSGDGGGGGGGATTAPPPREKTTTTAAPTTTAEPTTTTEESTTTTEESTTTTEATAPP